MTVVRAAFRVLVALLLAATPVRAEVGVVEGAVFYRERIALPAGATIEIRLLEVSNPDVPAEPIAETTIVPKTQVPIGFTLEYDRARIDERHSYALEARILVDGRPWFVSTRPHPVLTRGHPSTVEILVVRVTDRSDLDAFERAVARVDDATVGALRLEGSYGADGCEVSYVAHVADRSPLVVVERTDLGEHGSREVTYHFLEGELLRYRSFAHVYADAGAPSDGWYDRAMTIYFDHGRFAGGTGTINGRPAEPDEHEVRAAWREADELKSRLAAQLVAPD